MAGVSSLYIIYKETLAKVNSLRGTSATRKTNSPLISNF